MKRDPVRSDVRRRGARALLVLASLVIVIAGLRELKPIAVPLLIAVFLSMISAPLHGLLLRKRVPTVLSVLVTVLSNVAVLGLIALLVGGSVRGFAESLPLYQERLETEVRATIDWLGARGIDTSRLDWLQMPPDEAPEVEAIPSELAAEDEPSVVVIEDLSDADTAEASSDGGLIDLSDVAFVVGGTIRRVASWLTTTLLVFLTMSFLLLESATFGRRLEVALGWRERDLETLQLIKLQVQRYLGIKTLVSLATGIIVGLWVWSLGVSFPALWGLIAFFFNYIPSIGSILAAVPAVLLALADQGVGTALLVVAGYLVVNITLGNFLEPHLLGRRLGMSTLVVFVSLVFWGWLWGPIGMLLSVPLTMVLRIALENTEDLRWVAQLIAANPSPAGRPRKRARRDSLPKPS